MPKSRYDKNGVIYERLHWTPPKLSDEPLPQPECTYCGKPIQDISAAIQDKSSGAPVHFDCMISRLSETETLEKGDVISYIGGGRFGIVHFNEAELRYSEPNRGGQRASEWRPSPPGIQESNRVFLIKKIFELEDKEIRADWRSGIADHYSVT
jgi:hypothetical protein